ncbi:MULTISPECIES: DNA primase family protein [unclassified Microbacterium]|uniref:DNA primase family protein n=1 Tax=unclassified Microbacterium TaxID=2609290 RepID=UPI003467D348
MSKNEIRPSAVNNEADQTFGGVIPDLNSATAASDTSAAGRGTTPKQVRVSVETLVDKTIRRYLKEISGDVDVSSEQLRDTALTRVSAEIWLENAERKGTPAPVLKPLYALEEHSVVQMLLARHRIVKIDLTDGHGSEDAGVLAIYESSGSLEGIYNPSVSRIKALISELRPSFKDSALDSALNRMRTHAPVVSRTVLPHLIPVANGVFDHARQVLRPFTPHWVFLSKTGSSYDPAAQSPRIAQPDGTEWEVEEWFRSLSDDVGVPELLWQIVSAAVRPFCAWNQSALLVGPKGMGGKGTVLGLIRSLLGPRAHASIPLAAFGNRFALTALISKSVNLVDENEVGAFATKLGDWKSTVTGDVISVEAKYKDPIEMRWNGFEVQCYNEMTPRMKDKSESLMRRMLIVPMVKNFKGSENKEIKEKYLADPAVLSYVLKRALHMQHTAFTVPEVSRVALERWFAANNKVVGWWEEHKDQFVWDLLPWAFLYDAYKAWYANVEPSGTVEGFNQFSESLKDHLQASKSWSVTSSSMRPGSRMSAPEPLVNEHKLTAWMNQTYSGSGPLKRTFPYPLKTNYKGILRLQAPATITVGGEN